MKRPFAHPIFKVVGFFLILLLCALAQILLLNKNPDGYLFLVTAGLVAFLVIVPVPATRIEEAASLEVTRWLPRIFGLILLVIGLSFVVSSAHTFHNEMRISPYPDNYPWILYGIGLTFSLLGGLLIVGIGRLPRLDLSMGLILWVLALAVFVRVYQIDQYPFGVWFDEAIYGLHVRHWLAEANFRPIFVDNITFPHLIFDVLGLEIFGSANVAGLRLISALLGSAGVILAYLVGRMLRGIWFGLILAVLLAVLRWSIDFSRIGMIGAELVTFALFAFYTALRLIRYGRLRDALWFGLALGLGIYGYSVYEFQVIALALYFLIAYPFLRRSKLRTLILGVTALLALLVILTPILIYITDRSDDYFNRLNEVSIFNEDRQPGETLLDSIEISTIKHLEMFHLRGDHNGRHNLPDAPMLDPITGSLLIVGVFAALRERRRVHLLFFLSLVTSLLAGILSVSFEAPQALRTIGSIVGVIYFTGLGLEALGRLAFTCLIGLTHRARATYRLVGVTAFGALGVIAAFNFNTYFNLQRTNPTVWSAYSTVDSLTGRAYADYSGDTQFFVSPLIGNNVSVQFLAPNVGDRSNTLVMPDPFPLRIEANTSAVIMLVPTENIYLNYLHQLYPNAHFKPIRPVDYGVDDNPDNVLFDVIELTPQDIGGIQGLKDGQGVLYAPKDDNYTFTFASGVDLEIDNQTVVNNTPISLEEGNHRIAVTPADAVLTWQSSEIETPTPIANQYLYHDPVTPNGLVASFYKSPDWQGTPVVKRILPFAYWMIQVLPMDRPYSVRYDGYLYAPVSGEYRLTLNAIDKAGLTLDGQDLIETDQPNVDFNKTITLTQGWHPVEVRHQDLFANSRIFLSWKIPGVKESAPIARDYFCPTIDRCPTPPTPPTSPPDS